MGVSKAVRLGVATLTFAAMISLTGCAQLLPGASEPAALTLTVGAPAIPDGPLLAELYGQVLEAHSYDVFYNFGLTSREQSLAALHGGMIDFLPDFSGEVLKHLYPEAQFRSAFDVTSAARQELTTVGLTMLPPAPAENGLAFVTTKEFAQVNDIVALGRIASIETAVTIGAYPGFEASDSGRAAMSRIYAVKNWNYLAIPANKDQLSVDALSAETAQIVVMNALSPLITLNDLVVIADPGHVLPADNLIPIMAGSTYPHEIEKVVAGLSAALTTEQLRILFAKRVGENPPSDWRIANEWLLEHELLAAATAP